MSYYRIDGAFPLRGTILAQGAKNSAVHLIAATLLARDEVVLDKVPDIHDIHTMIQIVRKMGCRADFDPRKHRLILDASGPLNPHIQDPVVSELRASLSLTGALLARESEASILFPGGCNIGSRPVDFHLKGFNALGAETLLEHGIISAKAKFLRGRRIYLDYPSVGATVNITLAAVLAQGETILENVAEEPEIIDLCNLLKKMGAKIKGAGTKMLYIRGVRSLKGATHKVIPDRIEAGTYLVAGAMTSGELTVQEVNPEHLEPLLVKLQEAGVRLEVGKSKIHTSSPRRPQAIDIKTMPYPGFPTDLQNQMMAFLARAEGTSLIMETVFENRFVITGELRKMGADIRTEGHGAVITGVPNLTGAKVTSPNLRGGASLVLAALAAKGSSEVREIQHIDRGYEKMEEKLSAVGAKIKRMQAER